MKSLPPASLTFNKIRITKFLSNQLFIMQRIPSAWLVIRTRTPLPEILQTKSNISQRKRKGRNVGQSVKTAEVLFVSQFALRSVLVCDFYVCIAYQQNACSTIAGKFEKCFRFLIKFSYSKAYHTTDHMTRRPILEYHKNKTP